jgi:ppGpp synthetase/RelA/SpoT-type nucleotidyltranferase
MNLNDYEKKYFSIYEAFAETVRFILEKALLTAENLPQPQSVQCRAKGIESLRRRLAEEGKLDTQTLELDRRDLAGARLIFYTNNDVDRFLASSLIRDNFKIEDDSIKIHHPIPENNEARYRAVHYTVRLREDRIREPTNIGAGRMKSASKRCRSGSMVWKRSSRNIRNWQSTRDCRGLLATESDSNFEGVAY